MDLHELLRTHWILWMLWLGTATPTPILPDSVSNPNNLHARKLQIQKHLRARDAGFWKSNLEERKVLEAVLNGSMSRQDGVPNGIGIGGMVQEKDGAKRINKIHALLKEYLESEKKKRLNDRESDKWEEEIQDGLRDDSAIGSDSYGKCVRQCDYQNCVKVCDAKELLVRVYNFKDCTHKCSSFYSDVSNSEDQVDCVAQCNGLYKDRDVNESPNMTVGFQATEDILVEVKDLKDCFRVCDNEYRVGPRSTVWDVMLKLDCYNQCYDNFPDEVSISEIGPTVDGDIIGLIPVQPLNAKPLDDLHPIVPGENPSVPLNATHLEGIPVEAAEVGLLDAVIDLKWEKKVPFDEIGDVAKVDVFKAIEGIMSENEVNGDGLTDLDDLLAGFLEVEPEEGCVEKCYKLFMTTTTKKPLPIATTSPGFTRYSLSSERCRAKCRDRFSPDFSSPVRKKELPEFVESCRRRCRNTFPPMQQPQDWAEVYDSTCMNGCLRDYGIDVERYQLVEKTFNIVNAYCANSEHLQKLSKADRRKVVKRILRMLSSRNDDLTEVINNEGLLRMVQKVLNEVSLERQKQFLSETNYWYVGAVTAGCLASVVVLLLLLGVVLKSYFKRGSSSQTSQSFSHLSSNQESISSLNLSSEAAKSGRIA